MHSEVLGGQRTRAGARDLMVGELRNGELDLTAFIEVEDEAHRLLFTLHFSDAVKLTPRV